ncbi:MULTISPECIES: prepilin-type N-terminal cleavage/methylation domain-containing protein [unclassified Nocardioides]|uniref:prepilin-type N-terminal cleavage/methylation domain-containing protein n=1 Tax=unclassified Nocardioides TaxID=2615069 RepID=UPI0006F488A9|nr:MULTISPECIES: prepilin-type N-terminal cleavage/methylation domain-containing protein [unclassified Nocardioides]KRA37625.1 hypothetical protein ASD81_02650 [Nocardioides sp. Root614]KRA91586.1 hypothetical protein ASD84_02915 [Nocardioides sp. Root682]
MIGRLRRARRDPSGFTLIELLITVVIMGTISAGIAGVVISYLKFSVDTQSRMTESQDLQFVTAYWQRDVASIGVRSNVYNDDEAVHSFALEQSVGLSACAGPSGSTPLVTLAWSEYSSLDSDASPTTIKVTYVTKPDGTRFDLIRVRCGTSPTTVEVADNLTATPVITCAGAGGSSCTGAGVNVPASVSLTLSILDAEGNGTTNYTETISGERRQT